MRAGVDDRVPVVVDVDDSVVAVEGAGVKAGMDRSRSNMVWKFGCHRNFHFPCKPYYVFGKINEIHSHDCQSRGLVRGIGLVRVAADLRGRVVRLRGRVVHRDRRLAPVAVQRPHAGLPLGLKEILHIGFEVPSDELNCS